MVADNNNQKQDRDQDQGQDKNKIKADDSHSTQSAAVLLVKLQEHLDELMLLETRAARRSEQLLNTVARLTRDYRNSNAELTTALTNSRARFDRGLQTFNRVAEEVGGCAELISKHLTRASWLFIGSVIFAAVVVMGSLLWARHEVSALSSTHTELVKLIEQKQAMPDELDYHGRYYVKIKPNTTTQFSDGDGESEGWYAEMAH